MRRLTQTFWIITLFISRIFDHTTIAQFNLYESYPQQQCLYYYVLNDIIVDYDVLFLPTHQIIPYCLEILKDNYLDIISSNEVTNHHNFFTFAQLKTKQISAENLIQWSASIDIAEHYQMFLNDLNELSSSLVFYNCTKGWFGHRCEYTLYDNDLTFAELIRQVFIEKHHDSKRSTFTNGTCYIHIQCNRGLNPLCLDWREICDGKRDCADGADEPQQCLEREANECAEGYYRCHNGECIPIEFYDDDDTLNPDCSDSTDIKIIFKQSNCDGDPAFRCEEHVCSNEDEFTCGDGQCIPIQGALNNHCKHHRFNLENRNLLADDKNSHLFHTCILMMTCLTGSYVLIDKNRNCNRIFTNSNCPSSPFVFPLNSVAFGHVYLIYAINETSSKYKNTFVPPFLICYDEQLCGPILKATVHYNGYTCRYYSEFEFNLRHWHVWIWETLIEDIYVIFRRCVTTIESNCTGLFQCPQSPKCISKHRLLDGRKNCFDNSDEQFNDTCALNDPYRFQCSSDQKTCISPLLLYDGESNCPDGEDERRLAHDIGYELLPPFPMLCDGRIDMDPLTIDGRQQTDETDCGSHFPCDNPYTHCDDFWNCANGMDEANCSLSLCKPFYHPCVSPLNMSIGCLPLELAGDGIIHCRGGSDERHYCRNMMPEELSRRYRCHSKPLRCIELRTLCDRTLIDDLTEDDRCHDEESIICADIYKQSLTFNSICWVDWDSKRSVAEKIFCSLDDTDFMVNYNFSESKLFLRLTRTGNFPSSTQDGSQSNENISHEEHTLSSSTSLLHYTHRAWFCNRGIVIFTGGLEQRRCLCPPSYYGDRCQYQNQRVSLKLQFNTQSASNWRTPFYLIIMLIDNDYVIQSYDYKLYIPVHDCGIKFHLYLTYASRPKNSSKNYSVIIYAYNKQNLAYYTSWHLSIPFQFLPVNHFIVRLIIKEQRIKSPIKCRLNCGYNGECMKYENTDEEFCRCFEGRWGNFCERNFNCNCSQKSKCIGIIGNQSICLCSLYQFGSQCYLTSSACQSDTCKHSGTCVPVDDRISKKNFTCLCVTGYSGNRCEISETKIDISFDDPLISGTFFGHFINVIEDDVHIRTTVSIKIRYDKNTVTLYRSMPFHILFIEFSKNYYLTVLQEKYLPSRIISTKVLSSYRCLSINVLFNQTILNYHRLQRIKYYHLPCQMNTTLKCFYDEEYMCLCNLDHYAICFDFDHNMTYNCQGVNYCKNNGQCFQDHPSCPTASVCVCDECSYGTYCQLSSTGFDPSLDSILSYYIHSHLTFSRQPLLLKISFTITIIMFVLGIISSILSIIVFQPKNFQLGCDIYLFAASITSLLTMTVFLLKFLLLILSQMALITNPSVIFINCLTVDFSLKFLPNTVDWLYTCVAIERALIAWKGVTFNKLKSRYAAKWTICLIYIFDIGTAIHDPIHRQLIEDNGEKRIWCIVDYLSTLKIYNRIINIFHLVIPFASNLISILFMILLIARQRFTVQKNDTYRQHLFQEFNRHKQLLISSCILIICTFPRLVMSFTFKCMKSTHDSWLFLIGYFLPFVPSIAVFVIFVLPSEIYTKLFKTFFQRLRRYFKS